MPSGGGSPALVSEITEVCPAWEEDQWSRVEQPHGRKEEILLDMCRWTRLRGRENYKDVLMLQQ